MGVRQEVVRTGARWCKVVPLAVPSLLDDAARRRLW